jgi:phage tail-like protein
MAGIPEPEFSVFMPTIGHGFGTLRPPQSEGSEEAPPSASARAYLRDGLPQLYQENEHGGQPFALRFVGALETLLDPTVALLDALPSHFRAELAPADVLELLTGWLGIGLRESQPVAERREVVRHAMELGRERGTRSGIELALRLGFPGIPFRVEDAGGVVWADSVDELPKAPAPTFVVYCDAPLAPERATAVARLIEEVKPVHVGYRLRIKTPKAKKDPKPQPPEPKAQPPEAKKQSPEQPEEQPPEPEEPTDDA